MQLGQRGALRLRDLLIQLVEKAGDFLMRDGVVLVGGNQIVETLLYHRSLRLGVGDAALVHLLVKFLGRSFSFFRRCAPRDLLLGCRDTPRPRQQFSGSAEYASSGAAFKSSLHRAFRCGIRAFSMPGGTRRRA